MFGGGSFGGTGGYGGGYGGFGGNVAAPPGGGYGGAGAEGLTGAQMPAGGDAMASFGYGGAVASQGQGGQGLGGWLGAGAAQGEQQGGAPFQQQRQAQTLTPVTIHMLNDAVKQQKSNAGQVAGGLDAAFTVNGRELGMITLVACVESVQHQSTCKAFNMNDGTGRILVQFYGDFDPSSGAQEIRPGDYVRIFGHLRGWQGQEGVNAHQVALVENANEISYHTIEVAHVHLSLAGKLVKPAAPAPIAATAPQPSMASFPGIPGSAGLAQNAAAPGGGAYQQAGGMQFQQQASTMQASSGGQFAAPLFGGAPAMPAPAPAGQFAGTAPASAASYGMYGGGSAVAGGMGTAAGAAPGGPYGAAPAPGSGMPPAGNPYGGPYGGGAPPGGPGSNFW